MAIPKLVLAETLVGVLVDARLSFTFKIGFKQIFTNEFLFCALVYQRVRTELSKSCDFGQKMRFTHE